MVSLVLYMFHITDFLYRRSSADFYLSGKAFARKYWKRWGLVKELQNVPSCFRNYMGQVIHIRHL